MSECFSLVAALPVCLELGAINGWLLLQIYTVLVLIHHVINYDCIDYLQCHTLKNRIYRALSCNMPVSTNSDYVFNQLMQ